MAAISGVTKLLTKAVTTAPNAAPTTTATARSTTLPRRMKSRNSLSMARSSLPRSGCLLGRVGEMSYGRRILGALAAFLAFAGPASARPGIVGGSAAPADSWPSTVFLYGTFQDQPYGCTGSVVAPEWIVTAAHCAYGAPGKFADSMTAILNAKDYTDRGTRE